MDALLGSLLRLLRGLEFGDQRLALPEIKNIKTAICGIIKLCRLNIPIIN